MTAQQFTELGIILMLALLPAVLGLFLIVVHLAFQDPWVLAQLAKLRRE